MTTKLPGWISPYEGDLNGFEKRLIKALLIALEALQKNADADFRGNRSSESVRSFEALKKIRELGGNGK